MARRKYTDPEPVQDETPREPAIVISEGLRQDLVAYGWAVDPVTGRKLTRDDL